MTTCTFDPRPLLGQPIGMLHCPVCSGSCMVIAGLPHGPCEDFCDSQDDQDRELVAQMDAQMEREEQEELAAHRASLGGSARGLPEDIDPGDPENPG